MIFTFFFCNNLQAKIYDFETPIVKYLIDYIYMDCRYSNIHPIECVYVINLDRREDKWKRVSKNFNKYNVCATRVSAIDGWSLTYEQRQELSGNYPVKLQEGHTGCLLSHVSVLKDAYEKGLDLIWIVEDDIEILDNIRKILEILSRLDEIDPDWDVFYTDVDSKNKKGETIQSLSSQFRPDRKYHSLAYYLKRKEVDKDIIKLGQRFGNYSYIVSKKGIKKILDYFTHTYLWAAFDIEIHYIPGIREYSSNYDIVSVWWNNNDISDTRHKFQE
jgi:GR25 family glycosyltransferase involved in LPS biosynthesis